MKSYKFGAVVLAAALLCAPCLPISAAAATRSARTSKQDQDTPPDVEQAMFNRGQKLYNDGRYEQAVALLNDFLKTYPNSIITDLTLLWLGRSYIALGRIKDAEDVATRLRGIRDTPFIDIYDDELTSARKEVAMRGPVATKPPVQTVAARPSPTPREVAGNTGQSIAMATPSPTPARTPVRTPTPRLVITRPTPTPTPVAQAKPAPTPPTLTINNPPPTNTNEARVNTGTGRRPGRRANSVRNTPVQVASNNPKPVVMPTPLPVRPTPTPTPRRLPPPVQVATVRPTPTPTPVQVARVEPNESTVTAAPPTMSGGGSETGIVLTVKQVPNLALALRRVTLAASPGQSVQLPVSVTNMGNKEDQFRLETDLPAEYQPTFSMSQGGQDTGLPILITPQLARGQTLDVFMNLRVPETAADAQQRPFIVRAASKSDYQIFRVANGALSIVAAALAGSSTISRDSVQPGETFTQTITVRNQGSAPARTARADFVFNPDFELVSANPAPLVYDRDSRTAVWSLGDVDAREGRDISVTLRAVPDALAANHPIGRGTMRTASLPIAANFDGPAIEVGRVPKARIQAVSTGLTATPGDTIFIPFVALNPGNYAESYELRVTAPGAPTGTLFADVNGDGQHQDNEPAVSQTTALDARTGQYPLLLRVDIPRSTPDRMQFAYNIVSRSLSATRVASEANTVLTVAAPRVHVRTEQVTDAANPGDLLFYRLVLVNDGGGLAKNLVVTEVLPEALQFVGSEPSLDTHDAAGNTRRIVWHVAELAPGDTAVLRITVRLGANLQADADVRTTRSLAYQDTNGNSYTQGQ
ncbi:MAG: tetratricopeptide repeat protein [Pyrinomonadaceae bacterium]